MSERPVLGRETFGSAVSRLPRERVHIPALDGDVWLRKYTARELVEFQDIARAHGIGEGAADEIGGAASVAVLAAGVVRSLCDESGQRLYADAAEGEAVLASLELTQLAALFTEVQRVAGLGAAGAEVGKVGSGPPASDCSTASA